MANPPSIPLNMITDPGVPFNPPYFVGGVSSQGFFLPANPNRLTYLIDSYLNAAPREVAYFRLAAPFVLLILQNQQESGQSSSSGGMRFGFVSESTISFMIPLARYRLSRGRLRFVSFSLFTPFTFSSDPTSVALMSANFGWTGALGWATPASDTWLEDPRWNNNVLTLSTEIIPTLWEGERPQTCQFLRIEQAAPPTIRLWPPPSISNLFTGLGTLLHGVGTASQAVESLLLWSLHIGLFQSMDRVLRQVLGFALSSLEGGLGPGIRSSVISLKQFRDAEDHSKACYQGLIEADISTDNATEAGLLGSSLLMRGDLSGGYLVRLERFEAQPILELLGLEVTWWEKGRQPEGVGDVYQKRADDGSPDLEVLSRPYPRLRSSRPPTTAVLRPILPFWTNTSFVFNNCRTLCWRLRDTPWMAFSRSAPRGVRTFPDPGAAPGGNPYNSSLGPFVSNFSGPFEFAEVVCRVLPLKASRAKMQAFCDAYFDAPHDSSIQVTGDHLLFVVTSFGQMVSEHENVGSWAQYEIELLIPVQWRHRTGEPSRAVVAAYCFSDSMIGTMTKRQIFGINAAHARIKEPRCNWLSPDPSEVDQALLRLWAYSYPSLTLDAYPRRSILAEVHRPGPTGKANTWDASEIEGDREGLTPKARSQTPPEWLARLRRGHPDLISGIPSFYLAMKQIPAAEGQGQACYKAVVATVRQFSRISRIGTFPGPLTVRLHHLPLYPIVQDLGVVPRTETIGIPKQPFRAWQGDKADEVVADNPFWTCGRLLLGRSARLAWRAQGAPDWHVASPEKIADFVDRNAAVG